jgi:PAS domain S-box-containing protein
VSTWNAGAERIKGYASTEIIGQHFSKFYLQDEIDAGKCEHELAVAAQEGRFEDEGWRLRKDGERFWANVVITALHDPSGALFGFAKVTRDLTERMRAENARIELVRREQADSRKDEFLAIMGHELRNPLAPLVTAVQMIRLRGGRATDKEMGILERQLRQMTKVVSDLLDASRAMRETVALTPSVVEIGEILANAVDIASPLIQDQHHNLLIDAADSGLLVSVDPDRMAQVFGNVLNNAAKYTHRGGTLELKAAADGDDVVVTVSDNGQGIAPEALGQIFNLFTRGDRGLEWAGGGLGIGLAVARRIVLAHRGSIFAESDGPGRGSRFVVRLPRASVLAPAPGRPNPSVLQTGSRRRVIIVDDNRDAVEMMQTLLEHAGHDVSVAYDGPSALKLCEEMKPDAVFLDIGLPGMDGCEVARRARELGSCQRIPIVAISGYARSEDCARALANGFSAHLTKPVDIDEVAKLLEAC